MGKFLEEIPPYLIEWILKQHMFWVASAPLSANGHVNISPKGIEGTFHITNSRRVWYEDLSGTGAETVAHIRENGRLTILFHAFEGPPRIVRLYGRGFVHEIGTPEYETLIGSSQRLSGSRAVIGLDVHKVGTTCGYAVPYYQFLSHRTQLMTWAAKKEANDYDFADINEQSIQSTSGTIDEHGPINPDGMKQWWLSHNLKSLDGLPAFSVNLGKGLTFCFGHKPSENSHVQPTRSVQSTNSVDSFPADAPHVNSGLPQQAVHKICFPFQIRGKYFWLSYRYGQINSLLLLLLPYLIVFVAGITLGRVSSSSLYSRTFNLHVI